MVSDQLSLAFAAQPQPQFVDFPIKTDAAIDAFQKAAAKKFAHLPRPSHRFDSPWGFQRSHRYQS